MKLYLFDDATARSWSPFRLTRPAGELLYGCLLLRERAERFWEAECVGHLAGEELEGFSEDDAPPVVPLVDVPESEDRLIISSRFVPEWREDGPPISVAGRSVGDGGGDTEGSGDGEDPSPVSLVHGGAVVGWMLPAGISNPRESDLLDPTAENSGSAIGPVEDGGASVEIEGELLGQPWDLMAGNPDRIRADVSELYPHSGAFLPPHATQIGDDHPISFGHDVELEPGVVFDVRDGPVILEDGVKVGAHARLEGPLWVGAGSTLYGGSIAASSIGPRCKVRGEIEASVVLGFSNKAHDGFLGHAYLGRWVNLGALTTNSDLKNNYGNVRVRRARAAGAGAGGTGDAEGGTGGTEREGVVEELDTGLMKVGCFLGDHVKTGIGTLLTTGAVVGAGSNLFGSSIPPAWVPPFSWGGADGFVEHRIDAFLETARRAMSRRDQDLSESMAAMLHRAHTATKPQR